MVRVEQRILVRAPSRPTASQFPWKKDIVTTIFWIGEGNQFGRSRSAWNKNWLQAYGGVDTPDPGERRNYIPVGFTPRLNPFYCALPYNDVMNGQFKPEAPLVIPWFKTAYTEPGRSVCEDRWIAIRKDNRTCYAQWEDCGPFTTHQFEYVFLNERPRENLNHGAGLDVSPAVRDYLGLQPTDITDWHFVDVRDVPPGPWRTYGDNNHFRLKRLNDEKNFQILPEFHRNPRV